jgi:hypothetical protein
MVLIFALKISKNSPLYVRNFNYFPRGLYAGPLLIMEAEGRWGGAKTRQHACPRRKPSNATSPVPPRAKFRKCRGN